MSTRELINILSWKLNTARREVIILQEEIDRLKRERKRLIYEVYKSYNSNNKNMEIKKGIENNTKRAR